MRNNVKPRATAGDAYVHNQNVRQQKKERTMNYNAWDEYFINLLPGISSKSKLPIKVGALAAGPDHDIRLSGFNGLPNGVDDLPERLTFPEAYKWGEHAERNLIYFAAKNGIALSGCTIYTQSPPCLECTKAIIAAGFVECVVDGDGAYTRRKRYEERGAKALAQYKEESKLAAQMFKEKGIRYKTYYPQLKDRSAA